MTLKIPFTFEKLSRRKTNQRGKEGVILSNGS